VCLYISPALSVKPFSPVHNMAASSPAQLHGHMPLRSCSNMDILQVRDNSPPFRVLEKCQDVCLRDRTATNNLVRTCTSFDFQPGSRIASFSGAAEYEESTCYLTHEQAHPEGIGNLVLVPNSVHFTEVCLSCAYIAVQYRQSQLDISSKLSP
jgi:hypothetical protein